MHLHTISPSPAPILHIPTYTIILPPGAACSRRPFPVTSERKWVPSGGIAEMERLASIAIYKIALSEPCKGEFAIL